MIRGFQLLPECAPHSVAYILELLALTHCAGCQFYRAESRGNFWDAHGNHIDHVRLSSEFLTKLLHVNSLNNSSHALYSLHICWLHPRFVLFVESNPSESMHELFFSSFKFVT